MEIISYNIWDLPLWFLRNRDKRLVEIAQFLTDRSTDIICLQESWSLDHRKLISRHMIRHGYHDAVSAANIKRKNGGLLTFSKFPITSVRFIPFGRRGISVSEFIGNKGVLETIIATPKGPMKILNVHLHYESSKVFDTTRIRIRQLRKLFSIITHDDIPTILAGDFNEHDMMQLPAFKELFTEKGFTHVDHPEQVILPSYRKENPLVDNWINRITHSKRYDYILVKDIAQAGLKIEEYAPLYLQPPLSDHDPIVLRLSDTTAQ